MLTVLLQGYCTNNPVIACDIFTRVIERFVSQEKPMPREKHFSLTKVQQGPARDIKRYYPYRQFINLFVYRFVSEHCLCSTLRLLQILYLLSGRAIHCLLVIDNYCSSESGIDFQNKTRVFRKFTFCLGFSPFL